MLGEIGQLSLLIALIAACATFTSGMIGQFNKSIATNALCRFTAAMQFLGLSISFAVLTVLFVQDDFSVITVYNNSHSYQPLAYKITALWGNHEGSLLLWIWVLSLFAMVYQTPIKNIGKQTQDFEIKVLTIQSLIIAGFLILLIYTSNPFARILPYPPEGRSLNALLQDPGLIIHPPLLYIGYVGLSVNFCIACAALWHGSFTTEIAALMRRFALFAWSFLTAGIALGSWWAYYELGWGGFWFWDPVENASFIPWLVTTALLHSLIVTEKRGSLKQWSLLLSLTAFGLSLFGTFLVRSGILTSVHAFASDPERGLFILLLLSACLLAAFLLFALHGGKFADKPESSGKASDGLFHPISREGGLVLNNFLLTAAAAIVLIGTLFPLFVELFGGGKISVGPPYFNISFTPLMLAALGLMAVVPLLAWRRAKLLKALGKLWVAHIIGLVGLIGLGFYVQKLGAVLAFGFALWLMISAAVAFYGRWRVAGGAVYVPRRFYGMICAHFATAVILCAVTGVSLLSQDEIYAVSVGDEVAFRDYRVEFTEVKQFEKHNYVSLQGVLVFEGEDRVFRLYPERRLYVGSFDTTTEAAIRTTIFGDYYATFAEREAFGEQEFASGGEFILHLRYKPLAVFLWVAACFMVLGGLLSLSAALKFRRIEE